jgi:hypothetical protein
VETYLISSLHAKIQYTAYTSLATFWTKTTKPNYSRLSYQYLHDVAIQVGIAVLAVAQIEVCPHFAVVTMLHFPLEQIQQWEAQWL